MSPLLLWRSRATREARAQAGLGARIHLSLAVLGVFLPITFGWSAEPAPTADPWAQYNAAVLAYGRRAYAQALDEWQDLAGRPLPRPLRASVQFQLGNAQFRLGEPLEAATPEQAAELWRRSAEAYRAALRLDRRHGNARHNLALVEKRLARLTFSLGSQLHRAAASQPLDAALNTLKSAVDYLDEAAGLAPADAEVRREQAAAVRDLQRRLLERSRQQESRADQAMAEDYAAADERAEQQYRDALADADEAVGRIPEPASVAEPSTDREARESLERAAKESQERVRDKLSKLLTRMGRKEQAGAKAQADWNPDDALGQYEQALEHFQAARQVNPANAAARQGEREVRAAMEQLHVREGRASLAEGKQALANNVTVAARELTAALSHFEAAETLNPKNPEAASGAAEARRLLPDVLARQGRREQQAGEAAEPRSATAALPHYEEAQSAYQGALELAPKNTQAREGLQQVEQRLALLRQKLEAEANRSSRESTPSRVETLQQLLGQVRESQRDLRDDAERRRQPGMNDPQARKTYPDW